MKGLKRILSSILTVAIVFSSVVVADTGAVSVVSAAGAITKQGGWLESAYVEWSGISGADGYAVYIKGASEDDGAYKMLDNELVRKYPDHFRADALGLKAGNYVMKIVPYNGKTPNEASAVVSDTLVVEAHDRSGAAFSAKSGMGNEGVGAYNNDGTPKASAQIIYVTKDNAKTVTAQLHNDKGTALETYTGLQAILARKQKTSKLSVEEPLIIRFIGKVSKNDLDYIASSEEGLQIKGANAYSTLDLTIEGVGEDAVVSDFGFLFRNCKDVEVRNFAIMNFMDDGISIDTENENIWIHNMEFFYGAPGGDKDQVKGDGTVDLKGNSRFVTISYNRFYDSGKASLCGMGTESSSVTNTYHHNWFDHSDSRMPRIRAMSIHVYNNYFDGNSKYGVGSANGASVFCQNNYFENCKYPAITGMQGHDLDSSGKSTLSKEAGGVIKMHGNYITGATGYTTYQQDSSNFDVYEASSADEKIPSSVKAAAAVYNNFDTDSNFDLHVLKLDTAEEARQNVMKYAGRVNGGDFFATTGKTRDQFKGLTDATFYDIDTEFKNAELSYTPQVQSVGGMDAGSLPEKPSEATTSTPVGPENPSETTTSTPVGPENPSEPTTTPQGGTNPSNPPVPSGAMTHCFDTDGDTSSFYAFAGSITDNKGAGSYNGQTFVRHLKMDGDGGISFTAPSKGTLTLVMDSSGSAIKFDGTNISNPSDHILIINDVAAGFHEFKKGNGETHIYYISFVPAEGEVTTKEPSTQSTTAASESSSATTTIVQEPDPEESTDPLPDSNVPGDADNDTNVNIKDAYDILKYITGIDKAAVVNIKNADANNDKDINIADVVFVLTHLKEADKPAVVENALDKKSYNPTDIINDTVRFRHSSNDTKTSGVLKLDNGAEGQPWSEGYLEFDLNQGSNVTIAYQCGSGKSSKVIKTVALTGPDGVVQTNSTELKGGSGTEQSVGGTNLKAGIYRLTFTNDPQDTTLQILSLVVS